MIRNILRPTLMIPFLLLMLVSLTTAIHAQDATTSCSLSMLQGRYAVQGQGTVIVQFSGFPAPPFPFAEVAVDSIDGKGNITGRFTANVGGVLVSGTVVGTYTVDPDCTGTISLVSSLGTPINESFVLLRNGGLRLVQTDAYIVITRTMEKMRD